MRGAVGLDDRGSALAPPVVLTLLIDENVPESVTLFLLERGHRIIRVAELMLNESPDQIIAVTGDRLGAIVVTWDTDFRRLAARISKQGQGRLRRLSRINPKRQIAEA